jgi:hypothetical protein
MREKTNDWTTRTKLKSRMTFGKVTIPVSLVLHVYKYDDKAWTMEGVMVFNVTFNNISVISCGSVLLVVKIGIPGENHRPAEIHR